MSFEDLVQLPIYQSRVTNRKRVFMSFWMTSDENLKIIQKIEAKMPKKKKSKRKKKTLRRKQWQKHEK